MRRFLEMVPGLASWLTLFGLVFLSWRLPLAVVIFVILYDLYWFLKIIYLFFHLRHSFVQMRANIKINWLKKIQNDFGDNWRNIYHLVILPAYKESYETVQASIQSLFEVNYPKDKMILVLGIEERGCPADLAIAEKIQKEFGGNFFKFLVTVHPANLPGEIPGKGSNETWAIRQAKKEIVDVLKIPYENIIVSSFDVDTRPGIDYFALLSYRFLQASDRQHASYQPIPLFINNLHRASPFARLVGFTSTFWQFMQQARPHRLVTFSSHSLPFKGLTEVGFWPTDIVSEDSGIFFKLFNHYDGRWRVVPLLYPVYMDAVVGVNFWEAMKNLYKQQRRWAWGAENFAYICTNFFKNRKIKWSAKIFWAFHYFSGHYSWATNSFILFIFSWLPTLLGDPAFQVTIASYNLPRITSWIMNGSTFGIVTSAILSVLLLPPKLPWLQKKHYFLYILQWFLLPLTIILFSSFPALEAQTRAILGGRFRLGFWRTPKASPDKLL